MTIKSEPMEINAESIEIKTEPIGINAEALEVNTQLMDIKAEPLEIKTEPVGINDEPVGINAEPIEIKTEAVGINAEPIEIKTEPIGINAETLEVNPELMEIKAEPLEIKAERLEMKVEPADADLEPLCFDGTDAEMTMEVKTDPENTKIDSAHFDGTGADTTIWITESLDSDYLDEPQDLDETWHLDGLSGICDNRNIKLCDVDPIEEDKKKECHRRLTQYSANSKKDTISEQKIISCHLCKFITKFGSKMLERHIFIKHLNEMPYSCRICDFKTAARIRLKSHMLAKHSVTLYTCAHCEYKAKESGDLEAHYKNVHNIKLRTVFNTELEAVSNKDLHYCLECEFKSVKKSELRQHVFRKHPKTNTYRCPLCGYTTDWKTFFLRHVMKKHAQESKDSPQGKSTPPDNKHSDEQTLPNILKKNLASILQKGHKNNTLKSDITNYFCPLCEYTYHTQLRASIVEHIMTEHSPETQLSTRQVQGTSIGGQSESQMTPNTLEKDVSHLQGQQTAERGGH